MSKTKVSFVCGECGTEYLQWAGKCSCGVWGSIKKINQVVEKSVYHNKIKEIVETDMEPITITFPEIARVCTFVRGSVLLFGGEPGIGKSTLMSQIAANIEGTVLYLVGEETLSSVRKRFTRLFGEIKDNIQFLLFTLIDELEEMLIKNQVDLVILDSISTTRNLKGDMNIKDIILQIVFLARKYSTCFLVVSHITKDGIIAGPKMIEHMVDVVLYLESPSNNNLRFLRLAKNRFGSTDEVGVLQMTESGLVEVEDSSFSFLINRESQVPGSVIFAGIEGNRPYLLEIQSLVIDSNNTYVESIGFDSKRLNMIIAILQKWIKLPLYNKNIFVSLVGGIKTQDPAADLPVAIAILSSFKHIVIPTDMCFFGELGLTGEVRVVSDSKIRINEAKRRGFNKIYCAHENKAIHIQKLCNEFIKM